MVDILSLVGIGIIFSVSMVLMMLALIMGSLMWNIVFFMVGIVSAIAFVYQMHKVERDD